MIRFRCKNCGKKLKANEQIVGRRVRCTKCDSVEVVPEEGITSKSSGKNTAEKNTSKKNALNIDSLAVAKKSGDAVGSPMDLEVRSEVDHFEFSIPALSTSGEKSLLGQPPNKDKQAFTPQFQLASKKVSRARRLVMFGMIGGFLLVTVLVAVNFDRLIKARRMISTDYEQLAEVVYYRNAVKKLEKSYRMMDIAGRTYLAMNPNNERVAREFEEAKSATLSRTRNSDLEKNVESYFRQGEDVKAKALLVNTAVELEAWRKEIDLKTKAFSEATY